MANNAEMNKRLLSKGQTQETPQRLQSKDDTETVTVKSFKTSERPKKVP